MTTKPRIDLSPETIEVTFYDQTFEVLLDQPASIMARMQRWSQDFQATKDQAGEISTALDDALAELLSNILGIEKESAAKIGLAGATKLFDFLVHPLQNLDLTTRSSKPDSGSSSPTAEA